MFERMQSVISKIERRLHRARPGSVLIIVIVLLLLLAILGAAYLSTTRSTRISSDQFVLASTVQVQLEGIADAVTGIIANDLNDDWGDLRGNVQGTVQNFNHGYRGTFSASATYHVGDIVSWPVLPAPYPAGFPSFFVCTSDVTSASAAPTAPAFAPASAYWLPTTHIPITSSQVQPWLADRIPTLVNGMPTWPNISQTSGPTVSAATPDTPSVYPTSVLGLPFESPVGGTASPPPVVPGGTYFNLQPTYQPVGNLNVPAFRINGDSTKYIAGDADGDGIADCFLSRVPGMTLDGLTWYVGIRIIDNNSAINANTAWSCKNEFPFGGGSPQPNYYGLFQTGVGLQELIGPANANDFTTLTNYRFNNTNTNPVATPFDENGQSRSDFNFVTQTDELYHQLIRRLANPGWVSATQLAQSLPWSDSAVLASHFCLVDPNTIRTQSPASVIETLLPLSTVSGAQSPTNGPYFNSTPYGVHGTDADVAQWYVDNFDFDGSDVSGQTNAYGSVFPLRPFLTTRNPVSNYITPVYDVNEIGEPLQVPESPLLPTATAAGCQMMLPWGGTSTTIHFRGNWSLTASYNYDDIVKGPDGFTYIWISSTSGNSASTPSLYNLINATPPIYSQWQLQPWNPNPTKANINTATFRELYRDFWCVMAGNDPSDSLNVSPYGLTPPDYNIYDPDPTLNHNQQCMFRSPLRDWTSNAGTANVTQLDPPVTEKGKTWATGVNTMQLRGAIAAVNAIGLRNGSQDVISRTIILNGAYVSSGVGQTPTTQPVQVRVYSSAPQPVISEVYVNTYAASAGDNEDPNNHGSPNLHGYVAIELYNPYGVSLTLTNWQVGYITRSSTTYSSSFVQPGDPKMQGKWIGPQLIPMNPSSTNPLSFSIPAHGYALLENYKSQEVPLPKGIDVSAISLLDAHYRPMTMFPQAYAWPGSVGPWAGPPSNPSNTVDVWVPGLSNVIPAIDGTGGGEFVLLRPRRADGTFTKSGAAISPPSAGSPLSEYYDEGSPSNPNLADLVPVDSYDFSGLRQTGPGAATYNVWSYIRPKGQIIGGNLLTFRTTYPGAYTTKPILSAPARHVWTDPEDGLGATTPLQTVSWKNSGPVFGTDFAGFSGTAGNYNTSAFAPIQVYNLGSDSTHYPNGVSQRNNASQPQQFPFGSFARKGDILEVPYIGAYRISLLPSTYVTAASPQTTFLELNSLPMDSAMAAIEDAKDTIPPYENVGRFIPLANNQIYAATGDPDYFFWTRNIFNYFTVQSTSDDYFPNFDPGRLDVTIPPHVYPNQSTNAGTVYPPGVSPGASGPVTLPNVTQTYNRDASAGDQLSQDNVGVDGLININTASYQVLAQLPMVSPFDPTKNENLAKAIINWRNLHGPFLSPFDLNFVIDSSNGGFQNEEESIGSLSNLSSQVGILTPTDTAFPGVSPINTGIAEDFQADTAALTHISNMITTRSDTFTVYIVMQGWSNAGTANATPVITRRVAFIADRSAISGDLSTRIVKTINVPNE